MLQLLLRRVVVTAVWCCVTGSVAAQNAPPAGDPPVDPSQEAVAAQEDAAGLQPPTVTATQINEAIAALDALIDVDEATKTAARDTYNQAMGQVTLAAEAAARRKDLENRAATAPDRLATLQAELAQPAQNPVVAAPDNATLQQIEQLQAQAVSDLQVARDRMEELAGEAKQRRDQRGAIPDLLSKARQAVSTIDEDLADTSNDADSTQLAAAQRTLLLGTRQATQAQVAGLEAELASYDARADLLAARRDHAERRVTQAEKIAAAWQQLVSDARQRAADQAARDAQRLRIQAARQHTALSDFAAESEALVGLRTGEDGLTGRIAAADQRTAEVRERLASIGDAFEWLRRRVESTGLNRATGERLRRQYDQLPQLKQRRRQLKTTSREMEQAEYDLDDRQVLRRQAGNVDRVVEELLALVEASGPAENRVDIEAVARELAVARRDLLDDLVKDSTAYFDSLADLHRETEDLVRAADAYREFIEEHILWIPSIAADRQAFSSEAVQAIGQLVDPVQWRTAAELTVTHRRANTPLSAVLVVLILAAYFAAYLSRRWIDRLGGLVSSYRTDKMRYTFLTAILTIVAALPTALMMWILASWLGAPHEQVPLAVAFSAGLEAAGLSLFKLSVIWTALRPRGLADAHFRWPLASTHTVRHHLRWFMPVVVPIVLVMATCDHYGNEWIDALFARVVFTIGMAALVFFFFRVFRLSGPVLGPHLTRHSKGWISRLRYLWYPLLLLTPVALIIAAWMDYFFTAIHLQTNISLTLILLLLLMVANGFLQRWLFINRRRVAIEDARRRREQAIAEAEAADQADEDAVESPLPVVDDEIDLPAISAQTQQLFRSVIALAVVLGLVMIWADVLPALRMLDRVQILPRVQLLEAPSVGSLLPTDEPEPSPAPAPEDSGDQQAAGSDASSSPQPAIPGMGGLSKPASTEAQTTAPRIRESSLTLANLGGALLALLITWIAFRNLPGLVEIAVLHRLPLDAGARYALSTVFRYLIAIIGVCASASALGLTWSSVQWLAAALTFGLAFGLQEIFANFVSGLIILAERPFQVGDTVTIGGVSGTVMRIRMRATFITDWDRKELIIPNKTFITGDVVNWTLSDPVLRVIIPVGVSRNSDIDKVERILREVAEANDIVLDDPPPRGLFLGFGESTLNFELRVYIPHISHLLSTRHELHMAVYRAFRAESIEIAFPQRDFNLRSAEQLSAFAKRREDLTEDER